ncbi:polysaccharide biosynthesis C-terminal domain-containing protein [Photobacterium sp. BZF1]|uniref:MATE family efflux transporter n=1 Tax=Photobacterium sp. BZF1 TaxID=1904457 RepID=UPI0016537B4F|nr:polysaccharide biosynthesis C-terminal domain-containing protein [Photobacterium sp. BZF1]MBC7005662.1 polysaccharide biosynthesis C-terminal domain-containing protein [Photobacterium sp. BZF1]
MSILIKSFQVFVVRGFGAGAGFLMSLVVANTTDVASAGVFFFALALTQLGGGIFALGSPNALLKVIGADFGISWKRINQTVSVLFRTVFILAVLLLVVCSIVPDQIANLLGMVEIAGLLPLIAVCMFFLALLQMLSAMLQGKQEAIWASTVQNVIAQLSFIIVLGAFVFIGLNQTGFSLYCIYFVCVGSAMLFGAVLWFRTKGTSFDIKAKFYPELKSSLSSLFVVMLMGQCAMWAGQFATAKYLTSSDLAFFASAQRTATLASFVLIAVNLVVAPKFAQAFAKGNQIEVNKLSIVSSRLMIALAVPVLTFMIFLPEFLMGLFGEEYKVAAPLLQILAVGQFINVITGSVGYLLNMTGHEKDMRNVVLFSGPLAIVLAFGLTSQFGLMGAAYATAISVATQNLLAVWMVKKRLGFNTLNIFRKIADS